MSNGPSSAREKTTKSEEAVDDAVIGTVFALARARANERSEVVRGAGRKNRRASLRGLIARRNLRHVARSLLDLIDDWRLFLEVSTQWIIIMV